MNVTATQGPMLSIQAPRALRDTWRTVDAHNYCCAKVRGEPLQPLTRRSSSVRVMGRVDRLLHEASSLRTALCSACVTVTASPRLQVDAMGRFLDRIAAITVRT
jgi:hypothetical protein